MKRQYWACGIAVGAAILAAVPANAQSVGTGVADPYDAGYAATSTTPHAFTSVESHWSQPKVDCTGAGAGSVHMEVGLDSTQGNHSAELQVVSDCANGSAQYSSYAHIGPSSVVLGLVPNPGDVFDAKVSSDDAGNYTFYLKDETGGWDDTKQLNSPESTDVGAHAQLVGFADDADPAHVLPLPKFAPVTMSGTQANGKPIASFTPTKTVLADKNNKTLVDTSDIDAKGSFTLTQQN